MHNKHSPVRAPAPQASARESPEGILAETERALAAVQARTLARLTERGFIERATLEALLAQPQPAGIRITSVVELEGEYLITIDFPASDPGRVGKNVPPRPLEIRHQHDAPPAHRLSLPIDLRSERAQVSLHRSTLLLRAPKSE